MKSGASILVQSESPRGSGCREMLDLETLWQDEDEVQRMTVIRSALQSAVTSEQWKQLKCQHRFTARRLRSFFPEPWTRASDD